MNVPIAFISYSYDSPEHQAWVVKLAADLRKAGIEVILDKWDLSPGADLVAFMDRSIGKAHRVILVCSEEYVSKADSGQGGVGYERLIISSELAGRIDSRKFIPIVKSESKKTPHFLGSRVYLDFAGQNYEAALEDLVRELHGTPKYTKPPLGQNPYSSTATSIARSPSTESGTNARGEQLLDEAWFNICDSHASKGFNETAPGAAMEIRSVLHSPLNKSQIELLGAVRSSEITTFGWPIGVLIEPSDEYRPKPMADGIVAELAVQNRPLGGGSSYDYWYLRATGDFFLLHNLFEDSRDKAAIFFNTRIVRVAESLLFLSRLYSSLGVPGDSKATVRIGHRGLSGRELKSSSPNRYLWPTKATAADKANAQVTDSVSGLKDRIVDHVIQICRPMFMMFDFKEFDRFIYEDIIVRFQNGQVT